MTLKALLTQNCLNVIKRTFSSALYVTGDKASANFAFLTPALEFVERFENKPELKRNLELRNINIDLEKVERHWIFYQHLEKRRIVLEATIMEIGNEISKLLKATPVNDKDIDKFKLHRKFAKNDLKALKDYLYGVEEQAALSVLSLPNILNAKTPSSKPVEIYSFLEKPTVVSKHHIEIGKKLNLIEYTDPFINFLKGDAALFELSAIDYVSQKLLDANFSQFTNADFCRSVIVEGCGTDFLDKMQVFTLEEIHTDKSHEFSRLHLAGGASLYSFMAYFAKNILQHSYLPLKCFSTGRRYQPTSLTEHSLLSVNQETALDIFLAMQDCDDMENQFQELISLIIKIYEPLQQHFRLSYSPATNLKKYESLRLSIQMYSSYLQKYVEVGHCSLCDSYLSKRLLFTYSIDKERKFPMVISGSLIRIQPLLACMLENDRNLIPNVLTNYILKDSV